MATIALSPQVSARPARPVRVNNTAPESAASAVTSRGLQLTRRGRLVVTVLALLLVVGVGFGTAGRVAAGTPGQAPVLESVVVQPGQSLWGFAKASMPGTDTREAVVIIRDLNALNGSVIHPGQVLVVPAS